MGRGVFWSIVTLAALTLVTVAIGFLWLPSAHADFTAKGVWDMICRAAGSRKNGATAPPRSPPHAPRRSSSMPPWRAPAPRMPEAAAHRSRSPSAPCATGRRA